MSKNIARLAVTAGLTAALSFGGVMAPVTMAFAEDAATTTNSITINKNNTNGDVKYKAYQIFEADVVDEDGKTDKVVSNVNWAFNDTDTQDAIIKAINTNTPGALKTGASAQDVADWLAANISGNTSTTVLKDTDLLNTLAGLVAKKVDPTTPKDATDASFAAGTKVSFAKSGYYLFLTDANTLAPDGAASSKNTATSPIYAVVGAGDVVVTEKTSIPTVEKDVLEGGKWGKVSDSYIGEEVEYKLTGHVASNIATFNKYEYVFQDTLSKGLEVVKNSSGTPKDLRVCIVDSKTNAEKEVVLDATHGYQVTATPGTTAGTELLKVSFDNLKAVQDANGKPISVNADSKVVVTYKAKLNGEVEYKADGATNEVKLVYSNDPMSTGTGTSVPTKVTDHVFRLDVTKVDKDDQSHKLEATFQVKMTFEGNKKLTQEKWLTQDGGLTEEGANAGKFKTDKDSEIYIPGLVAGTYEITECDTPAGYNTLAPFTITVAPEYKDDGSLKNLNVTSSNTEMVTSSPTNDATISVTIQNKKGSGLPLTGLNGVTFTWIAGGAVLCIGVAHLIRSRKQAEESEQE
ncbi:MAG: isopeptide-forming domain-containing fimbrial protein [Collinsella sp.]|nr:isopeptide-forming domain-containing fimbrial protein [Collinsella sp.]